MRKHLATLAFFCTVVLLATLACAPEQPDDKNHTTTPGTNVQATTEADTLPKPPPDYNSPGNPHSKIDPELGGHWDLTDENEKSIQTSYLVITNNRVFINQRDLAANNPVFVQDGQIWYVMNGSPFYLYDYKLEARTLYLLPEKTDHVKPLSPEKAIVLKKQQ